MEAAAPKPRKVPSWMFGMAIILAPTLVFLVLVVMGTKMSRDNEFQNVTAIDRAHLVTGADLGLEVDPRREFTMKAKEDTGALRLTYRYPNELMPDDPVSIECLVVKELDAAGAKKTLDAVEFEMRKALDPRPGVLVWGDESKAALLIKQGRPVGTFYSARKGQFVFVLRVTGVEKTPEELDAAMRPKLEQLVHFGEPLTQDPG